MKENEDIIMKVLKKYFAPSIFQQAPVEDPEYLIIMEKYLLCTKPDSPFAFNEKYPMATVNDRNYVLYKQKKYRVYTKDHGHFETKKGTRFVKMYVINYNPDN